MTKSYHSHPKSDETSETFKVDLGKEELCKLFPSTYRNLEPVKVSPTTSASTVSPRPTPQQKTAASSKEKDPASEHGADCDAEPTCDEMDKVDEKRRTKEAKKNKTNITVRKPATEDKTPKEPEVGWSVLLFFRNLDDP